MTTDQLIRKLNSVGKKAFVEHFELYLSYADKKISRNHCIQRQVSQGLSNESGAAIRCGNASAIITANKECEALEMIVHSKRLSLNTRELAQKLILTRCKQQQQITKNISS